LAAARHRGRIRASHTKTVNNLHQNGETRSRPQLAARCRNRAERTGSPPDMPKRAQLDHPPSRTKSAEFQPLFVRIAIPRHSNSMGRRARKRAPQQSTTAKVVVERVRLENCPVRSNW
jgi:hypothetical protein